LVFEESNEALSDAKRIVLTSDGVHEYVSVDEMEDILNDENISPHIFYGTFLSQTIFVKKIT